MSDDFGTVNVRRGERAREIEVMRQQYRRHREALAELIADAPTEHLAAEYQRLASEIERALGKLEELEGFAAPTPPIPPPPEVPRTAIPPNIDVGQRPLETPSLDPTQEDAIPSIEGEPRSRVAMIVFAALLALALIAWLIWRASDRGPAAGAIVDDTAIDSTAPVTDTAADSVASTAAPEPVLNDGLAATPPSHDFGVIRKGTRAVRRYEISNPTDEPVTLTVSRSACRCLYYQHAPVIPPKAKETLTVTIDGAKAKAGELQESLKVASKADPSVATTIDVNATIR